MKFRHNSFTLPVITFHNGISRDHFWEVHLICPEQNPVIWHMNAFNTTVSEEHLSNLRDLIKSPVTQHVRALDLSEIMVTWVRTMAPNIASGENSPLRYITQVFNRRAGIILKTNYKHWRDNSTKIEQIWKLWYGILDSLENWTLSAFQWKPRWRRKKKRETYCFSEYTFVNISWIINYVNQKHYKWEMATDVLVYFKHNCLLVCK